jgi:NAD(P)-dependent dehydrogenase (short-subunit alcohol dehydrogenase family)
MLDESAGGEVTQPPMRRNDAPVGSRQDVLELRLSSHSLRGQTSVLRRGLTLEFVIRFDDRVVIVTGAGRGLGAAYAELLARRGATVVVHDAGVERDGSGGDPEIAARVARAIVSAGGVAESAAQNLASREACDELISGVLSTHGRIDALVQSAGIVRYAGIADTPDSEWHRMQQINVDAAWWLCRAVWPSMREREFGRIVLTTSGFALRPIPGADVTGYSVGKAALVGLMNGLAAEGAPHRILVNCIEPVAATRIFRREVGKHEMTPESVAPAAALLASEECRWSGQILVAQDGEFAFDRMVRTQPSQAATPEDLLDLATRDAPDLSL